jgi:hypothetical protein
MPGARVIRFFVIFLRGALLLANPLSLLSASTVASSSLLDPLALLCEHATHGSASYCDSADALIHAELLGCTSFGQSCIQ